jgi:transcriptional regulator with GAF, ATPase, and Fis domain
MGDGTLTPVMGLRRESTVPRLAAHLFVALECDRPCSGASRHALADLDVVEVGRGASRSASRASLGDGPGGKRLSLSVPDRWMSTRHAELRRADGRWVLADCGSTNGTQVHGVPVKEQVLLDGDLIETGHTLFLFREALPLGRGALDLDSAELRTPAQGLLTLSASLAAELASLPAVAASTVPVLIGGETGTGKEVVAHAIHQLSGRAGSFVAVNCGAIAGSIVESELFGYRKGAFSGAAEDRPGLVRSADRGTLFLDEIGDLPAPAQAALLRVLQENEVLPVGATRPVRVDVRVISATHRDLEEMVADGDFRADLFARIHGLPLRLPPLRERRQDLGVLIASLLPRCTPAPDRTAFAVEAARALFAHQWPLNVRELEKALSAAAVLAGDAPIDLPHLPEAVRASLQAQSAPPGATPLQESDVRRREELVALLREHRGNVSAVARSLGCARMQIHRWVRRYALDLERFRS